MTLPGSTPVPPPVSPPWPVVITEWALDSYLNLKHTNQFTNHDYKTVLRPDVVLLRAGIPSPLAQFANPKFWGPATLKGVILHGGYKMKWHNLGPGTIQLRLPVMSHTSQAFLCEAYVKTSAAFEQRRLARFKTHMNLISLGRYIHRGTL